MATDAFPQIMRGLDAPMFVVTTCDGHDRSGCLVGFGTQCSIDPPRFAVCISKANHTHDVARRSLTFAVHVLHRGDESIARLFGEETGDAIDKFARCTWSPGPSGVPVLDGIDWFAGDLVTQVDGGDHTLFVLDVMPLGHADRAQEPQLGYQDLRTLDAGHPA